MVITYTHSIGIHIAKWQKAYSQPAGEEFIVLAIVGSLARVESGSDDPDNLGHLGSLGVTFLVGQVDLIYKLNYLDVTQISHVL